VKSKGLSYSTDKEQSKKASIDLLNPEISDFLLSKVNKGKYSKSVTKPTYKAEL